jgi:broad specificity phosphatase PhoE
MSVQITYFVHGTTTDNEKGISSGWNDVELSDLGVEQAKELREQTEDMVFDVVFCSDLKRAVDSAEFAFGGIYKIITDKRLRECNYGKLNGAPNSVVEPMCEKECIYNKFSGGESYEDVKIRVVDFLNFLNKNYNGKSVVIVAHKAPQLALDVLLKNKTWEQALAEDWRKTKAWQPWWDYELN